MSGLVHCPRCKKDVGVTGFGRCSLCGEVLQASRPSDQAADATMPILRVAGTLAALAIIAYGVSAVGKAESFLPGVIALCLGVGCLGAIVRAHTRA